MSQMGGFTANTPATLYSGGMEIAGVRVTVKESEAHNFSSQPTQIALESGAIVSDHVIIQPPVLTVTLTMTNVADGVSVGRDAFATFYSAMQNRTLFDLITEHTYYKNLIIKNFSPVHRAPFKGAYQATLTMQVINFVELQSIGRSPAKLAKSVKKTASSAVESGKAAAKELTKTQAAAAVDAWKKITPWGD